MGWITCLSGLDRFEFATTSWADWLSFWWRCASVQLAFLLTCSFALCGEYAWDGTTVAWEWQQLLCVLVSGEAIVLRLNVRRDSWPDLSSVVYSRVLDMIEECTPQRLWERARDRDFCQCWMPHTQSHTSMCSWRLCGHCFTREPVSWYLRLCTVYWSPY